MSDYLSETLINHITPVAMKHINRGDELMLQASDSEDSIVNMLKALYQSQAAILCMLGEINDALRQDVEILTKEAPRKSILGRMYR